MITQSNYTSTLAIVIILYLASCSPLGLCLGASSACRMFNRVRDCPSWSTHAYGWVLQFLLELKENDIE